MQLDELEATHAALCAAVLALDDDPTTEVINGAVDCHLRPTRKFSTKRLIRNMSFLSFFCFSCSSPFVFLSLCFFQFLDVHIVRYMNCLIVMNQDCSPLMNKGSPRKYFSTISLNGNFLTSITLYLLLLG